MVTGLTTDTFIMSIHSGESYPVLKMLEAHLNYYTKAPTRKELHLASPMCLAVAEE